MNEIKLPSHWKVLPLCEVIHSTQYGLSTRGSQQGQYPILRMNCLIDGKVSNSNLQYVDLSHEEFLKFRLNNDDILFNRTNSFDLVGKTGLFSLEGDYVFASYLIRVIPNTDSVISAYLNYYLNWDVSQANLKKLASRGVSQSNINATKLAGFLVPIPPLPEQSAIAHTLLTIQKAKEARQRELELERERKAALMQYLFTHGTRNEPCKKTEIGEIPESWQVVQLKEVISQTQYGLSVRGNSEGRYPMLRMNSLVDGSVATDDLQFVDLDSETFSKFKLNKGDLLFNRTNSYELVGKVGLFNQEGNFVFASYLIRIAVDEAKLIPAYLNGYLNQKLIQRQLKTLASRGVSQSNINATKLSRFLIPLASLSEQRKIAGALQACDRKITALEQEAAFLDELFRAMLEEQMTGGLSALPLVEEEALN